MTKFKLLYNFYEDLPIIRIKRIQLNHHQSIFAGIAVGVFLLTFLPLSLMGVSFFIVPFISLPIPLVILFIGNFTVPKYNLTLDRYLFLYFKYSKKQKIYPYKKKGVK